MSKEDKELKIKELLAELPRASSFASVSITKQILKLSEALERETEAPSYESPKVNEAEVEQYLKEVKKLKAEIENLNLKKKTS